MEELDSLKNMTTDEKKLAFLLKREKNNLDLVRIFLASVVIIGHSYYLVATERHDIVQSMIGFTYSSSLAVKLFFFISGLVVTNSLISKNSISSFITSRTFRIFPGLVIALCISALAIGPLISNIGIESYYSHREVYWYIIDNTRLKMVDTLPGVFSNNHFKNSINGSLWTLSYEVGCYIFLLGCYMAGAGKSRLIGSLLCIAIIIEPLLPSRYLITWLSPSDEVTYLPTCFALGALLAINKDIISLNMKTCVGFMIMTWMVSNTRHYQYFFYITACLTLLQISSMAAMNKFKPKNDISYGIYIYGFTVQQCFAFLFPHSGVLFNQVASLACSYIIAMLSWKFIEKPSIAFGEQVHNVILAYFTRTSSR